MNISKHPGWHRLPNGVAVYSDAAADKYLNPEGMIIEKWNKRMTLMKKPGQEGIWTQIENTKDFKEQGDQAFRYPVPSWDPQRTLTCWSPSDFEDFYQEGSEVPLAPFPKVKDALHQIEWDDEDEYETGEADEAALAKEEPQHHERDPAKEIAIDNKIYKLEDEAKVL